ncbi:MAG: TrkA family potassium uptake protein [Candidatus Zixiibacteriota bacterium]
MRVVILGCSRVGAMLAVWLAKEGNEVTIIDSKESSFVRLPKDAKIRKILGMGIEHDTLKRAGIEKADVFLALTNSDNANIAAAQLAQLKFKVPKVISRVYGPQRAQAFQALGLNIICPTVMVVERFQELLKSK